MDTTLAQRLAHFEEAAQAAGAQHAEKIVCRSRQLDDIGASTCGCGNESKWVVPLDPPARKGEFPQPAVLCAICDMAYEAPRFR